MRRFRLAGLLSWSAVVMFALAHAAHGDSSAYDPLDIADGVPAPTDFVFVDRERSRELPVRVYLPDHPAAVGPAPVVLFSHGLGGSRQGNPYLGSHWAIRGYVVVFLQHPGSDNAVWESVPRAQRRQVLRQAASAQSSVERVGDVVAVLDQLERWNTDPAHPLHARLDLDRIGMAGHSFGAITAQAVSGQSIGNQPSFTDPRIDAAVLMSPSSPRRGTPDSAFGRVRLPWLLMTGTDDVAAIGDQSVADRLAVYPALPAGDKYELVLDGAEHSAFSDRALPGDRNRRNPNHHRLILAMSTAFWDAYLRDDPHAQRWLTGFGAAAVLEPEDRWQHK